MKRLKIPRDLTGDLRALLNCTLETSSKRPGTGGGAKNRYPAQLCRLFQQPRPTESLVITKPHGSILSVQHWQKKSRDIPKSLCRLTVLSRTHFAMKYLCILKCSHFSAISLFKRGVFSFNMKKVHPASITNDACAIFCLFCKAQWCLAYDTPTCDFQDTQCPQFSYSRS